MMKRTLCIITALLLILSVAAPSMGAVTIDYVKRQLSVYIFDMDEVSRMNCLFRSDLPDAPYMSAKDYLDTLFDGDFDEIRDGGVYTLSCDDVSMVIDTGKDTIHFDEFDALLDLDLSQEDEDVYYADDYDITYEGDDQSLDLDAGKYGIDLTEYDKHAYLPLVTLNDIFSATYLGAHYVGGKIYFTELMDDPYYDESAAYSKTTRTQAEADFTYNELCFNFDYFYGAPPKASAGESIKKRGLDKALDEYNGDDPSIKELLRSTDKSKFYIGLVALDSYLNDGGHTVLCGGMMSAMSEYPDTTLCKKLKKTPDGTNMNETMMYSTAISALMSKEYVAEEIKAIRDDAYTKYDIVKEWKKDKKNQKDGKKNIAAQLYVNGDTAVFVFDSFIHEVPKALKWSLEYAQKEGLKNFVLDISCNGGGSTSVLMYITSILLQKTDMSILDEATGSISRQHVTIDTNLDGKYDDKDRYTSYPLRYGVVTSEVSFSCGNLLPCLLQDNGIPVLGDTSGGGTCIVTQHFYPDGIPYYTSDSHMLIRSGDKQVDDGATPDYNLLKDDTYGNTDYSDFYNISLISQKLEDFYSKPRATEAPTESATESPTEAPTEAPTHESKTIAEVNMPKVDLSLIPMIIGAVTILIAVLTIIIAAAGSKRRKW